MILTRKQAGAKKKQRVYLIATLSTMAIFLPLQSHVWALYLSASVGYTILVFGLRRVAQGSRTSPSLPAKPISEVLSVHLMFMAVVTGWVWLALWSRPYLPYFLLTKDSPRPYFGLAFVGALGLLLLELLEQKVLRPNGGRTIAQIAESGTIAKKNASD
jgi:hypothetical protein